MLNALWPDSVLLVMSQDFPDQRSCDEGEAAVAVDPNPLFVFVCRYQNAADSPAIRVEDRHLVAHRDIGLF